jgi:hypothetical protein
VFIGKRLYALICPVAHMLPRQARHLRNVVIFAQSEREAVRLRDASPTAVIEVVDVHVLRVQTPHISPVSVRHAVKRMFGGYF